MSTDVVSGAAADVQPQHRRSGNPDTSRVGAGAGLGLGVAVLWLSLLVALPLAAVVGKSFSAGWSGFYAAMVDSETLAALRLTLALSVSVALFNAVMGTMIAWVLVRDSFVGKRLISTVIDVPFALPTIVAGLVMLALYGGQSPIGVHLVGTRFGIFVALAFVTLPFSVRTVQPVLQELDRDCEDAAASLGATPITIFRRVIMPAISPAVFSGMSLAFARALGEYGSVVLISSNLPFKTEIASSLIYGKLQDATDPSTSVHQAAAVATVLLLASMIVLLTLQVLHRRSDRRG